MINKKLAFLGFISFLLLLVTACSTTQQTESKPQHTSSSKAKDQKLTLAFEANPQPVAINKPVTLIASVKSNQQPVKDATVKLEVWKKGSKDHSTLEAKSDQKGNYLLKATYIDKGEYAVIMHVTASGVHQMMSSTFEVTE